MCLGLNLTRVAYNSHQFFCLHGLYQYTKFYLLRVHTNRIDMAMWGGGQSFAVGKTSDEKAVFLGQFKNHLRKWWFFPNTETVWLQLRLPSQSVGCSRRRNKLILKSGQMAWWLKVLTCQACQPKFDSQSLHRGRRVQSGQLFSDLCI